VFEFDERLYLRVDAEGRWSTFAERGALFRRSLDGGVLRARGRRFERLGAGAAALVHDWVGRRAGELSEALAAGGDVRVAEGAREEAGRRLARTRRWTGARLEREGRRFEDAYPERPPILPPHRYRDVVVHPAIGCPHHRCSFCAFYRDRPFHALTDDEFEAHVAAVRDLFGEALAERDGYFLGSASALSLDDRLLVRRLRRIRAVLGHPRRGVAAFLDADRSPRRDRFAWARLGEEGLVEATLGLETGDADLRDRLGKAGDLSRVAEAVVEAKAAGLALSLTVLLGIAANPAAERAHLDATGAFLAALPLGPSDRVYLSPWRGPDAREADVRAARRALGGRTGARLGEYAIERFAWLA
jgi:hypothetical protein